MDAYFSGLSKRQTMLLLTALTFGGADAIACFKHLPEEEQALLRHRADEIQNIPREKRIPLFVQEMKRLVTSRRTRLGSADPEQVSKLLKGERRSVVEVILRGLPANLADAVRRTLPHSNLRLRRELNPEVLSIVRDRLEQSLARNAPKRGIFKFSDLLLLESRELLTVCDRLGVRALATALAGLPAEEREGLFNGLAPDLRRAVAKAVHSAFDRALAEEDAREALSAHGTWEKDPSSILRSAGTQWLARACLAQSPEFAARLVERHRGDLAKLLVHWIREERRHSLSGDGGRSEVVSELERLNDSGVIEPPLRLASSSRPDARSGGRSEGAVLPGGNLLSPSARGNGGAGGRTSGRRGPAGGS